MENRGESQAGVGLVVVDLSCSADAAFVVDTRRRIVFWNEAAEQMLGIPADEVIGRACCDVVGLCRTGKGCLAARQVRPGERAFGLGAWISHEMRTRSGDLYPLQVLPCSAQGPEGDHRTAYILRAHAPATPVDEAADDRPARGHTSDAFHEDAADDADDDLSLRSVADALDGARLHPTWRDSSSSERKPYPPATTAGAPSKDLPDLTRREREVLGCLAVGMTNAEIATTLNISPITARNHVISVMDKLSVHTRLQAVVTATRLGLI